LQRSKAELFVPRGFPRVSLLKNSVSGHAPETLFGARNRREATLRAVHSIFLETKVPTILILFIDGAR